MARKAMGFWDRVSKTETCWLWVGPLNPKGYGFFSYRTTATFSGASSKRASRVAWEEANGPIPPGFHVDHICKVRACVRPDHLRLLTLAENNQGRDFGVLPPPRPPRRANDRRTFWERITIRDDECWEWTGRRLASGYGVGHGWGKTGLAHRLAYEAVVGPIAAGLVLDHLCRNRWCVNPDHLEPVQQRVNIERGDLGSITHCRQGHEYTEANTYRWRDRAGASHRRCRTCHRDRMRERYHQQRGSA